MKTSTLRPPSDPLPVRHGKLTSHDPEDGYHRTPAVGEIPRTLEERDTGNYHKILRCGVDFRSK